MKKRILWIDAVKGIAILMIFAVHIENWLQLFANYEFIQRIIYKGILGVEITYIVNSYLLCAKCEKIGVNNITTIWGGVLKYSCIRVLPLYWLALIIFIIYNQLGLLNENCSFVNVVSHFFLFQWIRPLWFNTFPGTGYMGILSLMWILFPFYKRIIHSFETALLGFAVVISITTIFGLALIHVLNIGDSVINYILYICRGLQSFSLGVLLFYIKQISFSNRKIVACSLQIISFICCLLLLLNNCGYMVLYTLFIIFIILSLDLYPVKIVVNPVFCFLGKHIFGIYLCHILLYLGLSKFILNPYSLIVIVFCLSILLSVLLEKCLEKPLIKRIKGMI